MFHAIPLHKEKKTNMHTLNVDNNKKISAQSGNPGILKMDSTGEIVNKYFSDKYQISISHNNVQSFLIDEKGYPWAGTSNILEQQVDYSL